MRSLDWFKVGAVFGIQSNKWQNAYIRADAGSVTSSSGSGGGNVNAQYYNTGSQPAAWELFKINISLCDLVETNDCYNRWTGTPALANGQKFILRKEFIYNSDKTAGAYGKLLTQYESTEGALGREVTPYDYYSNNDNNAGATAKKVISPYEVSGNEAKWRWVSTSEDVYWDGLHWCNTPMQKAKLEPANDSAYPNTYFIRTYGCGGIWSSRLYNAWDFKSLKADYDGYSDKRVYYFALFIKSN